MYDKDVINQGNDVPDKTIAVFMKTQNGPVTEKRIRGILQKPDKKRDWFTPNFYRCLPLIIGNTYGYVLTAEYEFSVMWDGGEGPESVKITTPDEDYLKKFPLVTSHFGSGIVTISAPWILRTPPGVNIMTVNPPNHILPAITVMTGVVETDNSRVDFTFNLKIQLPNVEITFPVGEPLTGIIPIPRYYADEFELKMADELFSEELVKEEAEASLKSDIRRSEHIHQDPPVFDRDYMKGIDIYGNTFPDHQKK